MPGQALRANDPSCSYLSDLSPKDKPWDKHKYQSEKILRLYEGAMDCYAERIGNCGGYLGFKWVSDPLTGELKLKLNACRFCRCRHCPICQWRRSLMWIARFLGALPAIVGDYPKARYIFLTLTVKNCEIGELRETLAWMNKAWKRMTERKNFPAIGFARSTEVTKALNGKAHPHFHALLMVSGSYFKSKNYLSQKDWIALWRSCLRVDYDPSVRITTVKNRREGGRNRAKIQNPSLDSSDVSEAILAASGEISAAIVEVFKYSIKPEDLIGSESDRDRQWLTQLTQQLHKTRAVALGGIFKNYLSEDEPENLIGNSDKIINKVSDITFGWRESLARYIHIKE